VDLPASYAGEAWLERVDPEVLVAAVPGKFEPIEAIEPVDAASKKRARPRKKSES
jgi:hypothetical protein